MAIKRRRFLQAGSTLLAASAGMGCAARSLTPAAATTTASNFSALGQWQLVGSLPSFELRPEVSSGQRVFHMVGNRALQMQAGSDGTVGLYEEAYGQRWLCYANENGGSGESLLNSSDEQWGSRASQWPAPGQITAEPTGLSVITQHNGLSFERRVVCPEGDTPWLFIAVQLTLAKNSPPRQLTHREHWRLQPRFLHLFEKTEKRDAIAQGITYRFSSEATKASASEVFDGAEGAIGPPRTLVLESLNNRATTVAFDSESPSLYADTLINLQPGESTTLYFRFGLVADTHALAVSATSNFLESNRKQLIDRLPHASPTPYPELGHEITWHYAALTGGANLDRVLGGHSLNQGSAYAFLAGGNAAARDQLQHALPLVYSEPDLALSILRNTCGWCSPNGDLPYALTGNKLPFTQMFRPSDQNLWALWLAAEYGLATGNLAAFEQAAPYHPVYKAEAQSLKEHLLRQYHFLANDIGTGAGGHLRILNADWNDLALDAPGVSKERMKEAGGSILNSAMAAWVLPVFAALLDKLDEPSTAEHARNFASQLKERVKSAWNGRWFDRAVSPDGHIVGRDECWLEVQPWAILCGAASAEQAKQLLNHIDTHHRASSPLGARIIWPLPDSPHAGMGVRGGIWYSINMTLVWAAATVNHDLAWDEWQRMSLASHTRYKPKDWAGTLSGPDAWNSPETDRPGETWAYPWLSMQDFPVGNMHSHSQPLLAYLRLIGVAPTSRGTITVGEGSFNSKRIQIDTSGHGQWASHNPVILETVHGIRQGTRLIRF
ncbi:MAG: hypothetical protein ACI9G5_002712 [Paracoccaceae bacterium]|jgi:hypothetical protein